MEHGLNELDSRIDNRGYFERILQERKDFDAERDLRYKEKFEALALALELQAAEYARRLHDLNGEYQRDRVRQNAYVTVDKFEDNLKAEQQAREAALIRTDEKFDEYVKRYEARQSEIDLLLAAQKSSTETAQRIAEEQGRKANRNIAVAGFILAVFIAGFNLYNATRIDNVEVPPPPAPALVRVVG